MVKGKQSGIGTVVVVTTAGVAYILFGGVAKADPNQGFMTITNNLNSHSRNVNIYRDNTNFSGAQDGYDEHDIPKNTQPEGYPDIHTNIITHNLWDDFRAEDSNAPYDTRLSFIGGLPSTQSNWLVFNFPYAVNPFTGTGTYNFGNKPIIFESDRIPYGPVVDIRRGMAFTPNPNEVEIPLEDVIVGTTGEYGTGILDIGTRLLADLNDDGIVNFLDFAIFTNYWRNHLKASPEVSCVANISGPNGIPDGYNGKAVVDEIDLGVVAEEWLMDVNSISKAMKTLPKELYERFNETAGNLLNHGGDSKTNSKLERSGNTPSSGTLKT